MTALPISQTIYARLGTQVRGIWPLLVANISRGYAPSSVRCKQPMPPKLSSPEWHFGGWGCHLPSPFLNMRDTLSPKGSLFSKTNHNGLILDDMNLHSISLQGTKTWKKCHCNYQNLHRVFVIRSGKTNHMMKFLTRKYMHHFTGEAFDFFKTAFLLKFWCYAQITLIGDS